MNSIDFVESLRTVVERGTAKSIADSLRHVPGRKPDPTLVTLSEWFNTLSADQQLRALDLVTLTAKQATYNVLLVLDGLLPIDYGPDKGRLQLIYVNDNVRVLLNDPESPQLSATFKDDI